MERNDISIDFGEKVRKFQKNHSELNKAVISRQLWEKYIEENYPDEVERVPVEEKIMKSLIQIYNFKLQNLSADSEAFRPHSVFQNLLQKAYDEKLIFSDIRAEQVKEITSEMEDFFYPDDFRISGNTKGEFPLLDRWNNKHIFIVDQFSEFRLEWEAQRKARESEALGKRNENYWKDVRRIEDKRKFLDDFANKHLDEKYKKEEKIKEEADAKFQILLKEFSKINKRGLQLVDFISKSKDKTRGIKLTKELTELKTSRDELVQKILDSDSNYTFKRFEW